MVFVAPIFSTTTFWLKMVEPCGTVNRKTIWTMKLEFLELATYLNHRFRFKRAAELKHGRVAMLASWASTFFFFPGQKTELPNWLKMIQNPLVVGSLVVLNHGRFQASVGLVTQHYVRLPGFDMAGTVRKQT